MATVIYNYFSENFDFVDLNNSNEFESNYKSHSAKDLKKVLKKLKCENGDLVAKKLRYLLSNNNTESQHADVNVPDDGIDHNKLLNNNFWGYVKNYVKKKSESFL